MSGRLQDELNGDVVVDGLGQVVLCPRVTMRETIPDRSPPELTRIAPSAVLQVSGMLLSRMRFLTVLYCLGLMS